MSQSENRLKIRNQNFSNEIDLDTYIEWDALSRIHFIDCNFKKMDLLGKIINFCNFKNSKFNDLSFRKCQFGKSTFENCEFVNIDLTRAELGYCKFLNCKFGDCDLSASDFFKCVFFETRLNNSNLKLSTAEDIKFWKSNKFSKSNSNEFFEVKNESNFEKILKDMNLLTFTSTDQDEDENC